VYRARFDDGVMAALHRRLRRRAWALGAVGLGTAGGAQGAWALAEPALPAWAELPALLVLLVVFGTGLVTVALAWRIHAAYGPGPGRATEGPFEPPRSERDDAVPHGEVEVVLAEGALWVGSTAGVQVPGVRVVRVEDRGDYVMVELEAPPGVVALPIPAAALVDALLPGTVVARVSIAALVARLLAATGGAIFAVLLTIVVVYALAIAGLGTLAWLVTALST
jgi:hypothetical protein